MDVALLNVRILFQENVVTVDEIGNRINGWKDLYSCFATISGEGGTEKSTAGLIVKDSDITFTVRYCEFIKNVDTLKNRIVFDSELYNIVAIDHMNYKKKSVKFKCERVRR